MLSEISQARTNTKWYHLYMELFKKMWAGRQLGIESQIHRNEVERWFPACGAWGKWGYVVRGYKLPVKRFLNSEDLMYNIVTINNTVFCT